LRGPLEIFITRLMVTDAFLSTRKHARLFSFFPHSPPPSLTCENARYRAVAPTFSLTERDREVFALQTPGSERRPSFPSLGRAAIPSFFEPSRWATRYAGTSQTLPPLHSSRLSLLPLWPPQSHLALDLPLLPMGRRSAWLASSHPFLFLCVDKSSFFFICNEGSLPLPSEHFPFYCRKKLKLLSLFFPPGLASSFFASKVAASLFPYSMDPSFLQANRN